MEIPQHLTECDKEPIHLFSKVTHNHYLLTLCSEEFKILQASQNLPSFLKIETIDVLLNQHIEEVFEISFVRKIYSAHYRYRLFQKTSQSFFHDDLYCIVRFFDTYFIVEIEASPKPQDDDTPVEELVQGMIESCEIKEDIISWSQKVAQEIQKISGYDRVLMYQFDKDYNGTVIAQSTHLMHEDFLNHRFPASDIPYQARQLYLKNPFRTIETIEQKTVDIVPLLNPKNARILDMSLCYFRSVSEIHLEYLKNMGVQSSMSISLIVDGRLWGLVACHHPKPIKIPAYRYKTYHLISKILSKQIEQKVLMQKYEKIFENKLKRELFFNRLIAFGDKDFSTFITHSVRYLESVIECEHGFVLYEGEFLTSSVSLLRDNMQHLAHIAKSQNSEFFVCDALSQKFEKVRKFSLKLGGMLWVKVPKLDIYLCFLKKELIQTINWAGKKEKNDTTAEVLTPRKSFQTWQEIVQGCCEPFDDEEINSAKLVAREFATHYQKFCQKQENDRLNRLAQELQSQAFKDPLTKLFNQIYYYEEGVKKFHKSLETTFLLSVIYIEVNNLETIKKNYGIAAYELALIGASNILLMHCDASSCVASRIGSHEFAVMIDGQNAKNAPTLVKKIEKSLKETPLKLSNNSVEIEAVVVSISCDKEFLQSFSDVMQSLQLLAHLKKEKEI